MNVCGVKFPFAYSVFLPIVFAIVGLLSLLLCYFFPMLAGIYQLWESASQFASSELPSSVTPIARSGDGELAQSFLQTQFLFEKLSAWGGLSPVHLEQLAKYADSAFSSLKLAMFACLTSIGMALLIAARRFIVAVEVEKNREWQTRKGVVGVAKLFSYLWEKTLSFALAFPHVAFIIALSFLISPSGWLLRILAPLFQWNTPPAIFLFADEGGWFYVIALALRETPFLLFFIFAANRREDEKYYFFARLAGRGRYVAWAVSVLPTLLTRIRLPIFLVFAYSIAGVEIAMLAGPQDPKLLSVHIFQLLYLESATQIPLASFLAIVLAGLLFFGVLALFLLAQLLGLCVRPWSLTGRVNAGLAIIGKMWHDFLLKLFGKRVRDNFQSTLQKINGQLIETTGTAIAIVLQATLFLTFVLASIILLLWSVVLRWEFPDLLPKNFTLRFWEEALLLSDLQFLFSNSFSNASQLFALIGGNPLISTLGIAMATVVISLFASLLLLETESSLKMAARTTNQRMFSNIAEFFSCVLSRVWWLVLPLLFFPEIIIFSGVQQFFLHLEINYLVACVWGHCLVAFPYLLLTLRGPYRAFDEKYTTFARLVGRAWWSTTVLVKWKILARPILFSIALAASVSFAQYLSTMFFGAGRIATVTSEAVNLFQSGNRRVVAVYSLVQLSLPLVLFISVLFLSRKQTTV